MSERDEAIWKEAHRLARLGMSRRRFLGRAGLTLGGLAVAPAVLAACGGSSGSSSSGSGGGKSVSISNWTSYMTDQSKKDFKADDRDRSHLHRGHQRQQRVLRQDPAEPEQEAEHRPRRVRAHRLDGEPHDQPGQVGPAARRQGVPEQGEPPGSAEVARLRSDSEVQLPWASGITGIAYNIKSTGKEIQHDRRLPLGEGHEDGAHRDARHGRPVHALARHRHRRHTDLRRGAAGVRQAREGGQRRHDQGVQRQRVRERPRRREPRRRVRVVGRRRADHQVQPDIRFAVPEVGRECSGRTTS